MATIMMSFGADTAAQDLQMAFLMVLGVYKSYVHITASYGKKANWSYQVMNRLNQL